MTAEIAIMNRESIALAADSAVTLTSREREGIEERTAKVFTSASKIFDLGDRQPLAIMIYGNTSLAGVPWETIISMFRETQRGQKYSTVEEFANEFFRYIERQSNLIPENIQERNLTNVIFGWFWNIEREIESSVKIEIEEQGKVNDNKIEEIITETIDDNYNVLDKLEWLKHTPMSHATNIKEKYEDQINSLRQYIFELLPLSDAQINKLSTMASLLFTKVTSDISYIDSPDLTGIVFAGYGEQQAFPSIKSFSVEGIYNNRLKYWMIEALSHDIDFNSSAVIIPFAQEEDMAATFMSGVDPTIKRHLRISFIKLLRNEVLSKFIDELKIKKEKDKDSLRKKLNPWMGKLSQTFKEELDNYCSKKYEEPVLSILGSLPKDELAKMAEALVNLTSLKHKVTAGLETVAGPIDVALITKGEGCTWIKSKKNC